MLWIAKVKLADKVSVQSKETAQNYLAFYFKKLLIFSLSEIMTKFFIPAPLKSDAFPRRPPDPITSLLSSSQLAFGSKLCKMDSSIIAHPFFGSANVRMEVWGALSWQQSMPTVPPPHLICKFLKKYCRSVEMMSQEMTGFTILA